MDSMQVLASEKEEILCQCPPQRFSVLREPHGEWVPCPIDPSHCVLGENLEAHVRRCPLLKQVESLTHQHFYQKVINAGEEDDHDEIESLGVEGTGDLALSNGPVLGAVDNIVSEMKRNAVYNMTVPDFYKLVEKIGSVHESLCKDIRDSYKVTEACGMWIRREVDRYGQAGMFGLFLTGVV